MGRGLNLPPSYVLIHRVSTAGIGVLCQLECEGEFRAEVLRWIPGYLDEVQPALVEDGLGATGRTIRGTPSASLSAGVADDPRDDLGTAIAGVDDPRDDLGIATAEASDDFHPADDPRTTSAPPPRARAAPQPDPPGSGGPRPFCGARAQAGWPCHTKAPGG